VASLPEALTDFFNVFLCAVVRTFELVKNLIDLPRFAVDFVATTAGAVDGTELGEAVAAGVLCGAGVVA
jgi:hypothetical protein